MEQCNKSTATYNINLSNLTTTLLVLYMRYRRSITIFTCASPYYF